MDSAGNPRTCSEPDRAGCGKFPQIDGHHVVIRSTDCPYGADLSDRISLQRGKTDWVWVQVLVRVLWWFESSTTR